MNKVCQIAFYLYVDPKEQRDDSWNSLKSKLLGDMGLLNGLKQFDITTVKKDMSSKAKSGISQLRKLCDGKEGAELVKDLKNKSSAAAGLFKWAAATDKYYDIFRMVEPIKKQAEEM